MGKRIKSLDDLNSIRGKFKADIDLRTGDKETRIVVHLGTCGIAAGARDILTQVIEELERASIETVTVRTSGCLGLCDQEPMLTLTDRAGREFCYGKLDKGKVSEIIKQHVISNRPVMDYMLTT